MEWTKIGMTSEDAQFLQTRQFGVEEVARWFNIPLGRLKGGMKPETYASAYMYAIEYVDGLRPWCIELEQAIRRQLIDADQTYFVEFLMDALLRGDPAARAAYYAQALKKGSAWMRVNEVRGLENLNPDDELDALALQPAPEPVFPSAREPENRARAIAYATATRLVRKEVNAVRKEAVRHAKDAEAFRAALAVFYAEHAETVAGALCLPMHVAQHYTQRQLRALDQDLTVAETWETQTPALLVAVALTGDEKGLDDA